MGKTPRKRGKINEIHRLSTESGSFFLLQIKKRKILVFWNFHLSLTHIMVLTKRNNFQINSYLFKLFIDILNFWIFFFREMWMKLFFKTWKCIRKFLSSSFYKFENFHRLKFFYKYLNFKFRKKIHENKKNNELFCN